MSRSDDDAIHDADDSEGYEKAAPGIMPDAKGVAAMMKYIKLDFVEPFEAHNIVDFTLEPKGDATNVTWGMHGPAPFFSKVMQVFVDMDSMVGKDFEVGLANLKAVAEN